MTITDSAIITNSIGSATTIQLLLIIATIMIHCSRPSLMPRFTLLVLPPADQRHEVGMSKPRVLGFLFNPSDCCACTNAKGVLGLESRVRG